jgi:hypothetical protein
MYNVWFFLEKFLAVKVSTVEKRTQMPFGAFLDLFSNSP